MVIENKILGVQEAEPKEKKVKEKKGVDTRTPVQKNLDKISAGGRKGMLSRIEAKLEKGGLSAKEIADKEAKAQKLRESLQRTGDLK